MTSQTSVLNTALQPPAVPTLNLGDADGNYSASGFSRIAPNAIVTGDSSTAATQILGLQIRITSTTGSLGVIDNNVLNPTGTSGKIKYEYFSNTKLLRLTDTTNGTATGDDFQAVLRNVGISGATGSVSIEANLGRPVYRSENGHYYEFVKVDVANNLTASWTASNTAAASRSFLGLTGYLATVTSAAENDFLRASFDSRGWLGARADANRRWTWVGGPEAGKAFWLGNTANSGGRRITNETINYDNWDSLEPNGDSSSGVAESYVQFTTGGKWNDLIDQAAPRETQFSPDGYWVEYNQAANQDNLAATRDTLTLTQGTVVSNSPDLVFYDETKGQYSFAFTSNNYNVGAEGQTANTPLLTYNLNNAPATFGPNWRHVSANLDVDQDNIKDLILVSKVDNSVVVIFGENRTGTTRQYAWSRASTINDPSGRAYRIGLDWTLDFASSKIGSNDSSGLFWRNKNGAVVIWGLTTSTTNGVTNVGLSNTSRFVVNLGPDTGWFAVGDGEFNQNTATRDVFWMNSKTSQVFTWNLNAARDVVSAGFAWSGLINPSQFKVMGIASVNNTGNDNIIWQVGNTVVVWNMLNNAYSAPGTNVFQVTAGDRIKVVSNVDGDGVLDLIAQNDGNGTIAAYTLTSTYALKGARIQYTSDNTAGYRPAKGGLNNSQLELVNVAQYGN